MLTFRQSTEAAIVQQFEEVKRHKPSIIYIPNVDLWYRTLGDSAVRTFTGLLRGLAPTEPVLLLGVMEEGFKDDDEETKDFNAKTEKRMLRDLFGYSATNQFNLERPDKESRSEYFDSTMEYIRKAPSEFPDDRNRKRRKLDDLPVAPEPEAPEGLGPSKADEKNQMKRDRQTLNMLKLHIQSVMDQIKLKYKKFRSPVIEDRDIAYLYDEQDPQVLTTDLNEEQRQQQQLFRPFELSKDAKGAPGLLEVASGKFYYNLEIVTIEKRLSNGYYKRPKDFLADIKRLAKDAKTSGDQDRTLKANEMLANVEVDMTTLEQQQPALVAECEALYEREQNRERSRLQKEREAQRRGEEVPKIVPNVPPPDGSKTTTEGSGPVRLGQEIPGVRPQLPPVTPSRMYQQSDSSHWSVDARIGGSHQTNGSTVPSRPQQEDSEMYSPAEDPSQQYPNTQGQQWSQRSAHTRIAQGSQAEQYHNSASTTTSGQKTSDKSNRSSGPPYSGNTQMSNGVRPGDHPDFSVLPEAQGGSQLPDTQEPSSQASSQPMAPPATTTAHRQSSICALLNNPSAAANTVQGAPIQPPSPAQQQQAPQRIILDAQAVTNFHTKLVDSSSGLSVEQLEQVNAALMDVIWRLRGEWNRNHVLLEVQSAFNRTVSDIERCQVVMGPSQPEA